MRSGGACIKILISATDSLRATMRQYLDLMRHILEHGTRKDDRTGTGTLSVFGPQLRFDLAGRFPAADHEKGPPQVDHP